MFLLAISRPKNLNEVSAQDHTVAVLKKTLESANVRFVLPDQTHRKSTLELILHVT